MAGGDGLGELGQKKKKVKANITTKIFTSLKGAAGQPLDLEGEGRGRSDFLRGASLVPPAF